MVLRAYHHSNYEINKMALPRVSARLPPYTPSKSTLAFGNRAIPKIVSTFLAHRDRHDVGREENCLVVMLKWCVKHCYY